MKLSELFRRLSYGELSNLAISNSGSGEIVEAKYPQLIQYANTALTDLHGRFLLNEKEIVIEQVENITNYELKSRHSESEGDAVDLYIKDTEEDPFRDDLIRVLEVWGISGLKYALNDPENPNSLYTPNAWTLQVPNPIAGQPMALLYQATHAKLNDLVGEDEEPIILLDQIINIPHYLENPLQQLIASKVFSHMSGAENVAKGQEHLMAYEAAILLIQDRDLAAQYAHVTHTKLEQRGFV